MKTVVVTGANRGIGLEFCRQFLDASYKVVAGCRQPDQAQSLRALDHQDTLRVCSLDVASENSIHELAKTLSADNIKVDLLINNAGVSIEQTFGQWTADAFTTSLAVNAIGPAILTQAIAPMMADYGKVIFISSGLGSIQENINPDGPYDAYAMSKATLSILCHRMASKQLDKRLLFAAISPGWVRTDMGGDQAPTSPRESVADMIQVIEQIDQTKNGQLLDSAGASIAW